MSESLCAVALSYKQKWHYTEYQHCCNSVTGNRVTEMMHDIELWTLQILNQTSDTKDNIK